MHRHLALQAEKNVIVLIKSIGFLGRNAFIGSIDDLFLSILEMLQMKP